MRDLADEAAAEGHHADDEHDAFDDSDPLAKFSQETIQQLRLVHVLNGHQIRSFAADFIRKA